MVEQHRDRRSQMGGKLEGDTGIRRVGKQQLCGSQVTAAGYRQELGQALEDPEEDGSAQRRPGGAHRGRNGSVAASERHW